MSDDTVLYEIDTANGNNGGKTWLAVPRSYKVTLGPGVPGGRHGSNWMFRVYEDAAKKNCVAAVPAAGYRRADVALVSLSNKDSTLKGYFARMAGGAEAAAMIENRIPTETEKAAAMFVEAIALQEGETVDPYKL